MVLLLFNNSATGLGLYIPVPEVKPRDPALDVTFDCYEDDRVGNPDQGVIGLTTNILGTWLNKLIIASPIGITLSISGTFAKSLVIVASPIVVTLGLGSAAFVFDGTSYVPFASGVKANWIKWSNIGNLDFTIGKDNVAGERPLDWKGSVYAIKKLGSKVVSYGENGVSFLVPAGTAYGLNTIYRIGLKSKNAVTGDEKTHFFIDKAGQLWKVGESLEKLDYSEYLSAMNNNLVMSHDNLNNLIYICDGSVGYVYNPIVGSLGKGPVNVTGISSQGGILYVVAPATIVIPTFEKWTDVYDMGTRSGKSIVSLEFGIDLTQTLKASIKYRLNKASAFSQTGWYNVDSRGMVFIQAYGQEFSFGAKVDVWESFKIDHFRINGIIHSN